jgi:hypothetical protein
MLSTGLASATCLQSLTKDHLIKNGTRLPVTVLPLCSFSVYADIAANTLAAIFKAYLADQPMDHLATNLRKGGVRDLPAFFPPNRREDKVLDEHFRKAGLPQVAEWWVKKRNAAVKETLVTELTERCERGEAVEQLVEFIKTSQEEQPLPEEVLVACIWQGFVASIDWSARPDQIEGLAMREVTVRYLFVAFEI